MNKPKREAKLEVDLFQDVLSILDIGNRKLIPFLLEAVTPTEAQQKRFDRILGAIVVSALLWFVIFHFSLAVTIGRGIFIVYAGLAFWITCISRYRISQKQDTRRDLVLRTGVRLRRCLFKGKCVNRRTRWHIARNYLGWYGFGAFGYTGLRIWLLIFSIRMEVWYFVKVYIYVWTMPFRIRRSAPVHAQQ